MLGQLTDSEIIIGDGTFDKVPGIFYELYTWHAKVGNTYPQSNN